MGGERGLPPCLGLGLRSRVCMQCGASCLESADAAITTAQPTAAPPRALSYVMAGVCVCWGAGVRWQAVGEDVVCVGLDGPPWELVRCSGW